MTGARAIFAAFAATLVVFVALDAVWLSTFAIGMFRSALGEILRPTPLIGPAVAFYILYAAGIVALAVRPALAGGTWRTAGLAGGILGLVAYATFDLTNLAVIKGWSLALAGPDMAWGTLASAVAAIAGHAAGRRATPGRAA